MSTPVRLFEVGFGRHLVSVIPPEAPLSPQSRVAADQRGKAPGRRNSNGTWGGYAWLDYEPDLAEVRRWTDAGANIGLKAADFPGVDIDTLDPWLSGEAARIAREVLGPAPSRIGRAPKQLLMYSTAEPFARMAAVIHLAGEKHLVEVLGAGRQYLVYGQHPCGSMYAWDVDLPSLGPNSLTPITKESVAAYFDALEAELSLVGARLERVGDGSVRDRTAASSPDLVAPSIDALRAAVERIPNADDLFPERSDYIKMGYAIKAAAGEANEEEGYDVFAGWAARHEHDGRVAGNSETWRTDWRRMHPPYSVGWSWIAELANRFGFEAATYEFPSDPVAEVQAEVARDNAPPRYSDQWLAEQVLVESGHRLRYVAAFGRWYVWSGGRWQPDAVLLADHLIADALRREAALVLRTAGASTKEQQQAERTAARMASASTLQNVRTLLRADPRVAAPATAFDADPWALNTPGGIVDLRTGTMRDHDPEAMCAKQTSVTPVAGPAPRWAAFLRETTGNDPELEEYLQRLVGYSLTGMTTEQMLAFLWGPGGNGKGVFVTTIQYLMQDYAAEAPMDSFTATRNDRHPTDVAGLVGARLVVASETQAGRKWDEQRLKVLTGGDAVRARYMRQDFFTYTPQFTLVFLGNHKPEIVNLDAALRRRIHMVPFTQTPAEVDTQLAEKLRAEAPEILAWAIEGCLRWQMFGLTPPPAVQQATEEYFEEEDAIERFLRDRCERDDAASTLMDPLFRAWLEWCGERGEHAGSMKRFSQLLVAHQLPRVRDVATRRSSIRGVRLLDNPVPLEAV